MPFLSLVLFLLTSWSKCLDGGEITAKPLFTHCEFIICASIPFQTRIPRSEKKALLWLPAQPVTTPTMQMMHCFLSFSNHFSKDFNPFIPHVTWSGSHSSPRGVEKRTGVASRSISKGGCSVHPSTPEPLIRLFRVTETKNHHETLDNES